MSSKLSNSKGLKKAASSPYVHGLVGWTDLFSLRLSANLKLESYTIAATNKSMPSKYVLGRGLPVVESLSSTRDIAMQNRQI